MLKISVQAEDFDAGAELAALNAENVGGIGSFIGVVRAGAAGVTALHLEHYPGMAEQAMRRIAGTAAARWPLIHCTIIHRFGTLRPGENIVFVGAASAHRDAALGATAFLIDWLKTEAPFWKREDFATGATAWVGPRAGDEAATAAWAAGE